MPRRWREALDGQGELDLSGARLLSDAHYLWSPGTLAGNLTSFFASKAVRSRVGQVKGDALPPALQHPQFKGKVYRLSELVLDVPSLIVRLAELAGDSLLAGERIEPLREGGELVGLRVDGRAIRAQRMVFSAGGGTAELLAAVGLQQPAMQRRPLHMVMLKAPTLKPLYAHCLGGGSKPRITVTSHPAADGEWVWYLGGDLAEDRRRGAPTRPRRSPQHNRNWPNWCRGSTCPPRAGPRCGSTAPSRHSPAWRARTTPSLPNRADCWSAGRPSWHCHRTRTSPTASKTALARDGIRPGNHPRLPALPRPPVSGPFWEGLL
ncbi:FAD-dependent oxidoreductase OS=Stutzerimonas stutzeri OX=316 GN=CXK95_05810 PE=4 SV=1 [Stutzerimonas stutzeri]